MLFLKTTPGGNPAVSISYRRDDDKGLKMKRYFNLRKPPYTKSLKTTKQLVICTGSGAWERGKSTTWFPNSKVVLPFGNDPAAYAWGAAAERDVLIAGFGELEPIGVIAKLGGLLLAAGAGLVLYVPESRPMIRIDAKRKEAA